MITSNLSSHSSPDYKSSVSTVIIDFDGTICLQDVTNILLENFALPEWKIVENEWESGKIGAHECMKKQISLLRATPTQINQCLDNIKIDDDFEAFIKLMKESSMNVMIASDGLVYCIEYILSKNHLMEIPIYSNDLVYEGNKRWKIEFPHKTQNCPAGHCKCQRFLNLPQGLTVYIGDGASDFCPSQKADIVLAKGRLADFCQNHDIEHFRINNFSDVISLWENVKTLLPSERRIAS